MKSRISNVGKLSRGMKKIFGCRAMGMHVKRRLYGVAAMPTLLYGVEIE